MRWFAVRHTRSMWAQVALALMVVAFLAPTMSRMLHAWQAENTPWGQVCQAEATAGQAGGEGTAVTGGEHCPMCLVAAHGWAPGADAVSAPILNHLSQAMPWLFLQAPRPLFAWSSKQARAPPQA